MSFRAYIFLMLFATAISWAVWLTILFFINPFETDFLGFLFFYLSLFLSLVGTIAIIASIIRRVFIKDKILFRHVVISFRQAIFFSILIISCLLLQSQRLLTWWNMMFLVLALVVFELFAISKKRTI
ncbi:MAG: hypothetical protein U9O55_00965 [Patescibacteria group bacterium]|nr:hypothetical protein [Patescibacteria group bacterium]